MMKPTISKADWLTAYECRAAGWYRMRSERAAPSEAAQFRMQQGQEIGIRARENFAGGTLVSESGDSSVSATKALLEDAGIGCIFEGSFRSGNFVTRADILQRTVDGGWHAIEVKSSFSDTSSLKELVADLAFTVMVARRSGLQVRRASLMLLSRKFRHGGSSAELFVLVECTSDVMAVVAEFDKVADEIEQTVLGGQRPQPRLISACRECEFLTTQCIGVGIANTIFEVPRLHHTKLKRLSVEGIVDLSKMPNDLGINDRQQRIRDIALSGEMKVDTALRDALAKIQWPCHYLDFETVATVLPLYDGHGCHQQVLTQFSVHRREKINSEVTHREYLADANVDCQRQLAEALIDSLDEEGAIVVYSSFEQTRIAGLIKSFPDLEAKLSAVLARLVDLLPEVEKHVYHPAFRGSFSLKKVLPALVPELSYEGLAVADGDAAITTFAKLARKEIEEAKVESARKDLLDYCKTDTLALVRLHEKLAAMAI